MDTVLPPDFDGIFRFTNPTDEDFIGKWDGKEYVFKAMTTSPIIMNASPLDIQNIRKQWAKKLAEREFFKSEKYTELRKREFNPDGTPRLSSFQSALSYNDDMLADVVQACLKPLPITKHTVREGKKDDTEAKLHKDEDGKLITRPVSGKKGMRELTAEFEA